MKSRGKHVPAVSHWWTVHEWGVDIRTGAVVVLKERPRRSGDRPGKLDVVWDWRVVGKSGLRTEGTAQNQKGARAAARKIIRGMPDKEAEPEIPRQMTIFERIKA